MYSTWIRRYCLRVEASWQYFASRRVIFASKCHVAGLPIAPTILSPLAPLLSRQNPPTTGLESVIATKTISENDKLGFYSFIFLRSRDPRSPFKSRAAPACKHLAKTQSPAADSPPTTLDLENKMSYSRNQRWARQTNKLHVQTLRFRQS